MTAFKFGREQLHKAAWVRSLIAVAAMTTTSLASIPDIGGNPIHTEEDTFTGLGFEAEIASYVFSGVGAELPDDIVLPPLVENETLIAYLIYNTGASGDVDLLGLLNPEGITPHAIGLSSVVPEDSVPEYRVNPSLYEGSVQLVQYQWNSGNGGLLGPGHWAVVFYRLIGFWEPVDAFVGLGSDLASQQIPGPAPIPEPGLAALLVMGGAIFVRSRRRAA